MEEKWSPSGCEKNTRWWCWGQWLWCSVCVCVCVGVRVSLFCSQHAFFFFFFPPLFLFLWVYFLFLSFSLDFWHCFYPWWSGLSGSGQKEEYFNHSGSCGFGMDDSYKRKNKTKTGVRNLIPYDVLIPWYLYHNWWCTHIYPTCHVICMRIFMPNVWRIHVE